MYMCHVPWRLLAVAVLLVGECSGGLGLAAEAAAHGDFAAPAQHGALPPQVQAMVAQLVETVEALRAEVLELKADRGRSQERAAALETRVGELELFMADVLEKEAAEAAARREMPAERAEAAEHCRLQAEQACASGQKFQAMTAAAWRPAARHNPLAATGAFSRPRASCRHVPVDGLRRHLRAVHGGLRRDTGPLFERAAATVPGLPGELPEPGCGCCANAGAGECADVPRARQHGGRGAERRDVSRWTERFGTYTARSTATAATSTCTAARSWSRAVPRRVYIRGRGELRSRL